MSRELYSKLDNVIAMFNKFIEGNHSGAEREDTNVRSEWNGLKGMLEQRPVKLAPIYNYFNRLDERGTGGGLQPPGNSEYSPPPRSPRQLTDLNKARLLQDIKRTLMLVRSNNTKLFKQ